MGSILDFLTQSQEPGRVQNILSQRFQPTAQDVGNAALAGVSGNEYVNPQQYADARMGDAMKQFMAMEQLSRQQATNDLNSRRFDLSEKQFAETQRHNMATETRLTNGGNTPNKPLPVGALKLQQEALDSIGTANSMDADLGQVINSIQQGKLKLGPLANPINSAMNYMGLSNDESRNFATFQSTLEKLRNDSLRLNKGVQTEGDAVRAWNEILSNLNDDKLVIQRLSEVQAINRRAAELQQMNLDQIRENYGRAPLDTSGYKVQPAIMNNTPAQPVNLTKGGWSIERVE